MESEWIWDRLDPTEQQIAELLMQGKSNQAICSEVFLSRARVQECIKMIQLKTRTDSTRGAIALLVEERETLSLLRVLEQAGDGVVVLQDRLVKFANTALERIHGYEAGEMVGIPFVELAAPVSRGTVAKRHERRMQGESAPASYVIRILRKDGQEKDALVASAGLIRYRGRQATLGIVISLEVEERETQTLLRVLEQTTDGVTILQDRLVKFANKALRGMLGYDPEEIVGMPFVELAAPGSRDAQAKNYDLRMRGETFPGSYSATALCKGGQEKDVMITSGGLIQYRGRPALLAIVVLAA